MGRFVEVWSRATVFLAAGLVLILPQPGAAEEGWVEITKPVKFCGGYLADMPAVEAIKLLAQWQSTGKKDSEIVRICGVLKVGDKFALDANPDKTDSDFAESYHIVLMWSPVCPKGCLPTMTPLAVPSPKQVGNYFKPTKPPAGW